MNDDSHYIIRGGDPGAERLRILSRAMRPGTLAVLGRAGLAPGLDVLDLGCGGGDATVDIARLVGPTGRVVGIDMDDRVLAHVRSASDARGLSIQWKQGRVEDLDEDASFDMAYCRFVMSHLHDPAGALRRMRRAVRRSGKIVVEDIDITTHAWLATEHGVSALHRALCGNGTCAGRGPGHRAAPRGDAHRRRVRRR